MHKGITALVIVGLLAAAAAVGATTLGPANGTASSNGGPLDDTRSAPHTFTHVF